MREEYYRQWRARPEVQARNKQTSRERRDKQKAVIDEIKSHPCADCGVQYPSYVMDFDHVRGEKASNVGRAIRRGWNIPRVLEEIAKCDLVCANCHRERTFSRLASQPH